MISGPIRSPKGKNKWENIIKETKSNSQMSNKMNGKNNYNLEVLGL